MANEFGHSELIKHYYLHKGMNAEMGNKQCTVVEVICSEMKVVLQSESVTIIQDMNSSCFCITDEAALDAYIHWLTSLQVGDHIDYCPSQYVNGQLWYCGIIDSIDHNAENGVEVNVCRCHCSDHGNGVINPVAVTGGNIHSLHKASCMSYGKMETPFKVERMQLANARVLQVQSNNTNETAFVDFTCGPIALRYEYPFTLNQRVSLT